MRPWVWSVLFVVGILSLFSAVAPGPASAQQSPFAEGRNGIFELVVPIWKHRNKLSGATWDIGILRDGQLFCQLKGELKHDLLDTGHTPGERFLVCPPTGVVGTAGAKVLYKFFIAIDLKSDGTIDDKIEYALDVIEENYLGEHPLGCIVTLYLGYIANQGSTDVFLVSDNEQACG